MIRLRKFSDPGDFVTELSKGLTDWTETGLSRSLTFERKSLALLTTDQLGMFWGLSKQDKLLYWKNVMPEFGCDKSVVNTLTQYREEDKKILCSA